MSPSAPNPSGGPALVPGELRGYRQFQLRPDGLYPLVHFASGAWDGRLERAHCEVGEDHDAPAAECRCGLYAWYQPTSASVSIGPVSAVIAARGRCILGDRGFRASAARVEAIALPVAVRWNPPVARRVRGMLAAQYPETRVYGSVRRMVAEHPPQDVGSLGIHPSPDHSRRYRTAAAALWATFVLGSYSLAALPRDAVAGAVSTWWPLLVLVAIGWQAGLVWLVTRLMAGQAVDPPDFGTSRREPPSDAGG